MNSYIILPGCDDGNRGDQALVWETKKIAQNAGFTGNYAMLCAPDDLIHSKEEGIGTLMPILGHPSRKFKNKDNTKYTKSLLVKWGIVAALDWIGSSLIYNKFTRKLIKPFISKDVKITLEAFECCDACFVKGGGFIHSYGKLTDIYTMYYFLYHIRLACALKKPVYVMPNSFGPFLAPTVKKQVRKALSKCKIVTVREHISGNMLSEIGVDNYKFPDLAFGLKKSERYISEFDHINRLAGSRPIVGITARPYRFPHSQNPDEKYSNYISSLRQFCDWIFDIGYFPVLVEHVLSNNTNEKDIKGIFDIAEQLTEGHYYILSNTTYNCRDLKKIYSKMTAVIGTRFHSVIFSISENVPCLAITYGGNKGTGIMEDMDLSEYSISIEDVSYDNLKRIFLNLIENIDEYKKKAYEYTETAKESISQLEQIISTDDKKGDVFVEKRR